MLLQGKIPGSDDIYKSSYFKENPGLLTEQDKVYSLAGPAVRQLERMSDHDIRKLFKWELTGEGIFLILCGKEESEDENSGKQDDSIIEYHGSDSKQKFDNSEERLKLECNEPSRNRIYGSSRQGRYIEELDNEYLLKDEDAYQFNNSQGAGFEILSENTSPERKIKIDGRDISIEYQEKDREEADIGNREKLLSHTYFGENIILKDKRKIYGELSGELIYIYGPGKKDQLTIEGFVNGDYGITLVEKYREKEEKEEYITYTDFRIRLDCIELIALKEFQIEKSTHDHTKVRIKGVIREEDAEKYEKYLMKEDPEIQITYGEDDSKVLFKGIVSNYDLSFNNFDYFLELEAVSYSILLDREKRTVVYQNLNTSYNEVLSMINRRYDNINISFAHSSGGEVPLVSEEFPVVIQYKETDWEFLKRISSYLNKALIIDDCKDLNETINIQLGFHRGSARPLENVAWSECKETGPGNTEYNYYRVSGHQYYRTEEVFAAGQKVSLNIDYEEEQQVEMGIIRTRIYVEEDILYTDLVLCREEDINMLKYQRENFMEGRSFRAEVMKLNDRHQAKVKFIDIEDEFKEAQAFWFPIDRSYTESYIAPEVGEIVDVYLKDRNERQAGIRSNYRREEEAEPSDKIITTPGEYVLKLNNESIYIRSKEKETELEILEDRIKIKSSDNKGFIEKDEIDLEGKKGQILLNNSVSDLKFNSRELEIKGGKISMK